MLKIRYLIPLFLQLWTWCRKCESCKDGYYETLCTDKCPRPYGSGERCEIAHNTYHDEIIVMICAIVVIAIIISSICYCKKKKKCCMKPKPSDVEK